MTSTMNNELPDRRDIECRACGGLPGRHLQAGPFGRVRQRRVLPRRINALDRKPLRLNQPGPRFQWRGIPSESKVQMTVLLGPVLYARNSDDPDLWRFDIRLFTRDVDDPVLEMPDAVETQRVGRAIASFPAGTRRGGLPRRTRPEPSSIRVDLQRGSHRLLCVPGGS